MDEHLIEVNEEYLKRKVRENMMTAYNPALCNIDITNLEITTAQQYFELIEMIPDEEMEDFIENNWDEYCLIGEIIALEVALYCVRRVSRAGGENSDVIRRMIAEKIAEYEKEFNKSYKDPNGRCAF